MTRRLLGSFARVGRRFWTSSVVVVVLALAASACGPGAADALTSVRGPILGGTADTTNEAVMALIQQSGNPSMMGASACTGTTIAKVGASGILVTAGHCVVGNDGKGHVTLPLKLAAINDLYVLPGTDWQKAAAGGAYYGVGAVALHPRYDGAVDSPYDVALIRYLGATASTPVIPALAPAEDALIVNSKITLVGYGKTETDAQNSVRRKVDRQISVLSTGQFGYDQTDLKGACEGDSGGPALFQTANGIRVAGVTSFGDAMCRNTGVSVRLSSAAAFIQSFIAAAPATLPCEECTTAAVGPGNSCVAQGATCANPTTPCGKYLNCAVGCQNAACLTQCRNTMSAGATTYDALATCQCGGMCAAACTQDPVCGSLSPKPPMLKCGGLTDSRPACLSCITGTCCTEAATCAADPSCAACQRQPSAACNYQTTFNTLKTCLAKCTGAPCAVSTTGPGATPDGGATPDAGATSDAGAPGLGPSDTSSGCACATSGADPTSGWGVFALGALGMIVLRLRRRVG
ncbi:MAG TPA: trypsin-like serine protease [Polyangia bacterium]|nr:trypsin-like serine protease [Polyangia bacterium]